VVSYLERAQNVDGGLGADRGQPSSQLHSGWAALGLAAAGRDPARVRRGRRSLLGYLQRGAPEGLRDTGEIERTILVLRAAGRSPRRFAGRNLVRELARKRRGDGSIDGLVNLTAFGILAFRAAGKPAGRTPVRQAAGWLLGKQHGDGGFGLGRGSDVDVTGAALQALVAAGKRRSPAARRAIRFLRRAQNRDGGFPVFPGGGSNAQSTAFAVQGIVATRRNSRRFRAPGSRREPIAYLRSLIGGDGGVRYSRGDRRTPVWVSAQALAALKREPFPLR